MARKEGDLTAFEFVQFLDPKYFPLWTDDEKTAIEDKDKERIAYIILDKLNASGFKVQELHIIIHDKDTRKVWDEREKKYVIDLKPAHIHVVVRFLKDKNGLHGGTLAKIAKALQVEPQYIEKPKKGKYAYDNMISYLIHIKYAQKYQYEPDEVLSIVLKSDDGTPLGTTYMEYYSTRKKDWEEGRIKVTIEQAKLGIDALEEKILTGQVTRSQVLLTDNYFNVYAHNKRRCEDAFDSYASRKVEKTIKAMEDGQFRLSVFFITGKTGSGKSKFTEYLVQDLQAAVKERDGEDWHVCSCAASNPFDEYNGEEILVMDDLRGIALTASDWLKLLDPDRINVGSARYHNKKIACRVIFINSEKDILNFFYFLKGNGGDKSESMDQFFRRLMARIIVIKDPFSDERYVSIGLRSYRSVPYLVEQPHGDQLNSCPLRLHNQFLADDGCNQIASLDSKFAYDKDGNLSEQFMSQVMEYGDAIARVTDMVLNNNRSHSL